VGIEITRTQFNPQDHQAFKAKLGQSLTALHMLLDRPGFGCGGTTLGAELEMYVVDAAGHPLFINQEILALAKDPQLTLELNRYNLEYNLSPYTIEQHPLQCTEQEILAQLEKLSALADPLGGRIVTIGILPTLRNSDFGLASITQRKRYFALMEQLSVQRGSDFEINISGKDRVQMTMGDVTLEGANTSFQIHYRVNPDEFSDTYNAIQLITPLVLALSANSPTLFGQSLWQETRIPLFKQSIDSRHHSQHGNGLSRVNFGHDWLAGGAAELFTDSVRHYPPLLPICDPEDPIRVAQSGGVPSLAELRLHQSSIWLWNRPVYDDAGGGHLRIEMRTLPGGPTAIDMVANAAMLLGIATAFKSEMPQLVRHMPFEQAHSNFYRTAKHGLDAKIWWPETESRGCVERSVTQVLDEHLHLMADGLAEIGISAGEICRYTQVIRQRLQKRTNGAVWQLQMLQQLKQDYSCHDALHLMLESFIKHSRSNTPVAQWPVSL
jgi:gamma-glutamyl:cysteine ligase YbdK (ATP-grasp superfamily)